MKKFFFSVAALAAAMTFTACSSEDIIAGADSTGAEWDENGYGYVTVGINLPVEQPTSNRANDNYKDGDPAEYKVNKVMLLVFGNNVEEEQGAVFAGAYELNLSAYDAATPGDMVNGAWGPSNDGQDGVGNDDNITAHNQAVAKISRMGGQHAYILAIINAAGRIKVNGNELLIDGAKFEGTFADFCKLTNKAELDLEANEFHGTTDGQPNGFLMLNAPMADLQGGHNNPSGANVHVLAHVDRSQIKASKDDAVEAAKAGKVAAQVYVERAVAKVTLSGATGQKVEGTEINWSLTQWSLDNTNKSSYVIRNIDGVKDWLGYYSDAANVTTLVDKWRFVGSKAAESYKFPASDTNAGGRNLWRTYFAKDLNYDSYESTSFNYVGDGLENDHKLVWHNGTPGYCAENTFNVRNQIWGATTRAIVKTTLNDGNDFYAVEGSNVIYTAEEAKNAAQAAYVAKVIEWATANADYLVSKDTDKLTFTQTDDGKNRGDKKPQYSAVWADDAFVFANAQQLADNLNIKDFGDKDYHNVWNPGTSSNWTEEPAGWHTAANEAANVKDKTSIPAYSNDVVNLCVYAGGVTYYETRIKHFGEDGCPWNTWEAGVNKPSVSEGAYPGSVEQSEKNYLGRWGVLRNNWYDLTVTKISKIGSATIPTLKGNERNTDDELDQYIAVDVNILSWAYRGQKVEF